MNPNPSTTSAPTRPEAPAPAARTPEAASCGTASPWDPQLDTMVLVDRWNFRLLV